MKGTHLSMAAIAVIVVLLAAAVPIGFAYWASTDNSGNNADVTKKSILIYDDTGTTLECMELPHVEYTGEFNNWTAGYYDAHVAGKMKVTFPETLPDRSGKVRVWVDMEDLRSWAAVNRITLSILGVEYVLFNSSSSSMSTTGQTNGSVIAISSAQAADLISFQINVVYSQTLNFNPYADIAKADFLKSKIMFSLDTSDPVFGGYLKVTYKNPTNSTMTSFTNYLYVTEGLFYGDLLTAPPPPTPTKPLEGKTFVGWYKDKNFTNQWDFANDRLDKSMFNYWQQDNIYNMNLYAKFVDA